MPPIGCAVAPLASNHTDETRSAKSRGAFLNMRFPPPKI